MSPIADLTLSKQSFKEKRLKYWFLLPSIIFLLLMGIFPLIFSLYLSFASWKPGAGGITWVGLKNYSQLIHDTRFFHSLWITILIIGVAVLVELILATFLAVLLDSIKKGSMALRLAISIPILMTPIGISHIWRIMLDYQNGVLNYLLEMVGIEPIRWLGTAGTAITSLILVDVWQWTPFVGLFLFTALQSQNRELYEAASMDGANKMTLMLRIVLPLLIPFMITILLLRFMEAIKIFDTIYVMTGGGPGVSTENVTVYAFTTQFRTFNMGYMSAMGWGLLIITNIVFFVFVSWLRRLPATQ